MIYIIRHIILKNPKYNLDYLFFKYHTNISNKIYNKPKDLNILSQKFNITNYTIENTLILDDKEEISPKNNQNPYNDTPYKSLWIKPCNVLDDNFENDNELTTIILELNTHFQSIHKVVPIIKEEVITEKSEDYVLPEGWKKVQSQSRPGQFSFENKFSERIPDPPKYKCGEFPNSSKDLEDYE